MASTAVYFCLLSAALLLLNDQGVLAINCYTRTMSTSSANGGVCTGATICYNYTTSFGNTAGCGSCPGGSTCFTCNTNLCNMQPTIRCKQSLADLWYSGRTSITCNGQNSCYEFSYSFGFINYFSAGCGDCSSFGSYSNCRVCTTDNCNTGSTVTAGLMTAVLCALAAIAASVGGDW